MTPESLPVYFHHAREAARYTPAVFHRAPRRIRRSRARMAGAALLHRAAQLNIPELTRPDHPSVSDYWRAFSAALALQPAAPQL